MKGQRGAAVVELGAKNGFQFSPEELIKVIDVFEKKQSGELSESEFANFISSANLHQNTKDRLVSNAQTTQTIELVFLGRRYTKKVAPTTQTITTISAITPDDLPSSSAIAQVIEFMEKTAKDEALQKQLQTAIGVGDGNISNIQELDASEATALKGKYGASVVNLAKENGFNFSSNDLIKVIDIFEKHQAGEISETKFSEFLASSNLNKYAQDRLSSAGKTIDLIFQGRRYRKTVTTQVPANNTHQATAQVVQFMEKTGDDSQLKQELKQILGVGDGDISSVDELDAEEAQALKSQKNSLVIELASKYGFQFSVEDLNKVIDIFGQQKLGEISPEDFSLLTGIADAKKATTVELMYLGRRYRKTTLPNGEIKIEYVDNKKMRSAKSSAVISFMLRTAEDAALKQEVKSVLGVGDGDISTITELDDEEAIALKGKQGSAVIKLAAKYGFQFSVDDLIMVVDAFEQRQAGKISQKEFALKTGLSELEKQSDQGLSLFQKTVNFFSGKR
ncbi:hypothetical protein BCD67_12140 [Oscillatoriales cyanobacterium USR001]|nr:hypothetical protein BCD67_12140 [Oscillatoriales cyanobacterium USR001]